MNAVDQVAPATPVAANERPVGAAAPRLATNAFWTLAGHLVGKASGFAFVILVARGLGTAEFGHFSFALSFVALFLLAGSYAVEPAVIREIARNPGRLSEVFASGLVLRAGLASAGLVLAVLISPFFVSGGRDLLVVALIATALWLDEMTTYTGAVYKAFERAALHGIAVVANRTLSVGLAALVLLRGGDLLGVAMAFLAGSVGALVFAWAGLRRCFPPIDLSAVSGTALRELRREGTPMAISGALNAALFRAGIVMVQALSGPVAGGHFGVAYRFFDSLLFLTWAISDLTLPRIARAGPGRDGARGFQLGVAGMLACFLPVAAIAPFAATWAVTLLFSGEFAPAATAVPWLAAAAACYGVAYAARVACSALSRTGPLVGIAGLVLAANVVANLVVIPRYGFRGAAIVICASEVLEAGLLLCAFRRANGGLFPQRFVAAPFAAAAATVAVLAATGARDAAAAAVGTGVYLTSLAAGTAIFAPGVARSKIVALQWRRTVGGR